MATIAVGSKREERLLVTSEVAIDFMGLETARVLSTPHLVGFLEMTARNLAKELVGPANDSVGSHINVFHLAATPVGMQVRVVAEVTGVDGRRVNFKLEAYDEREKIAEGTHQRVVVEVARFAARVQAKAGGQ
jgi:fluoroacetyl-CoA thioesterase